MACLYRRVTVLHGQIGRLRQFTWPLQYAGLRDLTEGKTLRVSWSNHLAFVHMYSVVSCELRIEENTRPVSSVDAKTWESVSRDHSVEHIYDIVFKTNYFINFRFLANVSFAVQAFE